MEPALSLVRTPTTGKVCFQGICPVIIQELKVAHRHRGCFPDRGQTLAHADAQACPGCYRWPHPEHSGPGRRAHRQSSSNCGACRLRPPFRSRHTPGHPAGRLPLRQRSSRAPPPLSVRALRLPVRDCWPFRVCFNRSKLASSVVVAPVHFPKSKIHCRKSIQTRMPEPIVS